MFWRRKSTPTQDFNKMLPTFALPEYKQGLYTPGHGYFGRLYVEKNKMTEMPMGTFPGLNSAPESSPGILSVPFLYCHNCREVFHRMCERLPGTERKFLFFVNKSSVKHTVELIRWTENRIKVKDPVRFSIASNYDKHDVVCLQIEPSNWWTVAPIRFQFFTCVLKAGSQWDGRGEPLAYLKTYKHFVKTWGAVEKFINGETWFNHTKDYPKFQGWYLTFASYSAAKPHLQTRPEKNFIKDRAYHLWLAAGKPHGKDKEVWEQAEKDIGV